MNKFIFDLQRFDISFSGGSGTKSIPYQISSIADLQQFAIDVNAGNSYVGKYFLLVNDLDLSSVANWTPIGTEKNPFAGTIDGNGKTINVAYNDGSALFNYVNGANISNLTVAGTINTSEKFAAGLISHSYGNTTVEDCISSVTINSTVNGNGTHGGFVGVVEGGKLTINNSIFYGSFNGKDTNCWGGFVGGNNSDIEITSSIFDPAHVNINLPSSATFARGGATVTDSYYTKQLNTAQGEQKSLRLRLSPTLSRRLTRVTTIKR